jgi:hypothetical protein
LNLRLISDILDNRGATDDYLIVKVSGVSVQVAGFTELKFCRARC